MKIVGCRCRKGTIRLGAARGHRLFAQNMHPGFQRLYRLISVISRWRSNDRNIGVHSQKAVETGRKLG